MIDSSAEGREQFVRELVIRCLDTSQIDVYRRLNYVAVIENITGKAFIHALDEKDVIRYRDWMYMARMLDSEKALDYLGEDFKDDIFKFNQTLMQWVMETNRKIFNYLGEVSKGLTFGEVDINFDSG